MNKSLAPRHPTSAESESEARCRILSSSLHFRSRISKTSARGIVDIAVSHDEHQLLDRGGTTSHGFVAS